LASHLRNHAAPFVKWAGGKGQLLKQLAPYLPERFGRYVEPFVGGGAVFFHLYRQGRLDGRDVVLIDRLEELIDCYRIVRDEVGALLAALEPHEAAKLDRDHYYRVRAWDRQPGYGERARVERAARFIYLNRTCYNGLYRVNRKGQFNVPMGRYRNPTVRDVDRLRAASTALQGVTLLADDFCRCLDVAEAGDLVYFDPPYQPLSQTANFTAYTAGDFGEDDQWRLAEVFRELDARGCRLLLNNSDTPSIRRLYDGYEQIRLFASRPINSKTSRRGAVAELLIVNEHARAEEG
jgi:DNA adenine methylase